MISRRLLACALLLTACGQHAKQPARDDARGSNPGSDAAVAIVLPPAPPMPAEPLGLPAPTDGINPLFAPHLALGELLFYDPRLSTTGTIACATCHDPAHDYSGNGRQPTAAGAPNLRRAPSLSNLKWQPADLGWDGRYASLDDMLPPHIRGQMGDELPAAIARVSTLPVYRAHLDRIATTDHRAEAELALSALQLYVRTRYQGDSPWDKAERSGSPPADLAAGYALYMGKAQCSVCHPPPLYTDLAAHRLGLIATKDEGRGRVAPDQAGAFQTPGLRGAASRTTMFHDGSAADLDAAIDWHLAGGTGQGADRSIIDPALKPVKLTADERAKLGAFVRALTKPSPPPAKPTLP